MFLFFSQVRPWKYTNKERVPTTHKKNFFVVKKHVKIEACRTNASKTSKKPLKIPPRHPQNLPEAPSDALRCFQDASQTPLDPFKTP